MTEQLQPTGRRGDRSLWRRPFLCLLVAAASLAVVHPAGADVTYTTITAVTPHQLSNGEQITVQSDGVLEFGSLDEKGNLLQGYGGGFGSKVSLRFSGARSGLSGKNFINVGEYPVSYITLQVSPNAKNGVGIDMTVAFFTPSSYSVTQSADQQSVLITVNSERTLAQRPGAAAAAGGGANAAAAQTVDLNAQGLLSVHAVDADIHELLARIARLSSLNIVVDDRVNRKISLQLDAMPPVQVLQAISAGYGLALANENGVYMVSEGVPTDLATYHLSGTRSFRMNYLDAKQASSLLPTFLFQYLHVNNGQNAVVVTAPEQMLAKIKSDLAYLDQEPKMIQIDALAVEFTDTEDAEQSLGFSLHRSDRTTSLDTASGSLEYQTIGQLPYSFAVNLNALIQKGRARIRANPNLTAVNGQTADIFIGDEKFIQVQFNGGFGGLQTQIQGVDVGTTLKVTPWTGGNGEITTNIEPEVSNISDVDLQSGLPILSDRKASTTVRVKDGDTIVIGGLVQRQRYVTNSKIPLLGDLPLIGKLFQSHKTTSIRSELVLFITPHILDNNGQNPQLTPGQRQTQDSLLHSMEETPSRKK